MRVYTFSNLSLSPLVLKNIRPLAIIDRPAIVQPIGPASARKALPAAIPPPPAAKAPPPNQAKAALVAAAPLKAEMAVPVDATPKVVATPIATVGPRVTTATPAPTPAAPCPAALTSAFLYSSSIFSACCFQFTLIALRVSYFNLFSSGTFRMRSNNA